MSSHDSLIVVVDDAEEMREVLAMVFARQGYQVIACEDADQAFEVIRRERPILVVTDLMMVASNGFDLISRIRSDLSPPVPPVIACSGFSSFEKEALERGAAAFIPKPFELETLQRVVATVLAHRHIAEQDQERALQESHRLRNEAIAAAHFALARLAPQMEDWTRRAGFTTRALPAYFGFGEAFNAFLRADQLCVHTSSNDRHWPRDQPLELAICQDMLETASPLVVPDLRSLGANVRGPSGVPLRFFAGVPLLYDQVAIGVLCFVDEQPRRLDAQGFGILEALARRASSVLSEFRPSVPPLWTAAGLTSGEGLEILLSAELSRAAREELMVGLLFWCGGKPTRRELPPRTAVAHLREDCYALLVTRPDNPESRRELIELIREQVGEEGFVGGGLVTLEGGGVPTLDSFTLTRTAESLLERAQKRGAGAIEQLVIRREPLPLGRQDQGLRPEIK